MQLTATEQHGLGGKDRVKEHPTRLGRNWDRNRERRKEGNQKMIINQGRLSTLGVWYVSKPWKQQQQQQKQQKQHPHRMLYPCTDANAVKVTRTPQKPEIQQVSVCRQDEDDSGFNRSRMMNWFWWSTSSLSFPTWLSYYLGTTKRHHVVPGMMECAIFHRNEPTEIHCKRKRKYIPESGLPHRLCHLHSFPRLLRYRLLLTAGRERARPSYVRIWGEREISMPTTNMFKGENISMARCSLHTYRYLLYVCTRGNADAKSKREEKTELESRQRQLARWWQCL